MPELPEVETVRRTLEPILVGRRVEGVSVGGKPLREKLDGREIKAACEGQKVQSVRRLGKYLLLGLSGDRTLVVHLGMTGQLKVMESAAAAETHQHLVLLLDGGKSLRYRDPRRFGLIRVVHSEGLEGTEPFVRLGMDPLLPEFSGAVLRRAARGRKAPIKSFLLDGRAVAGVGNIYASEALFAAGIHPTRSVARLSRERWQRLAAAIARIMAAAIEAGGTTLSDYVDGEGREGAFGQTLAVYGREGAPCPSCGSAVKRRTLAGRGTFYCPRCQR